MQKVHQRAAGRTQSKLQNSQQRAGSARLLREIVQIARHALRIDQREPRSDHKQHRTRGQRGQLLPEEAEQFAGGDRKGHPIVLAEHSRSRSQSVG